MQQWVKDGVAEVAQQLAQKRDEVDPAGFPLEVHAAVRDERPDIIQHLNSYGSTDPYQYVKMYIPDEIYR